MKSITIEGQLRTEYGKQAARRLRSQELVPGVIYGGAKEISFSAPAAALKPLVYTPDFFIAEVNIDGTIYKCILKDLQFGKVSDKLIHVDLLELVEGKKVVADIPLKYIGAAIGVKDGGHLVTKMKSLKVKTYPGFLQEHIEVNIENLAINGNIRVEDVKIHNFEILNSPRIPIVSVVVTRALKVEEAAAATTTTAAPASTATPGAPAKA